MRLLFALLLIILSFPVQTYAQLEVTTGYAVNRNLANGVPIQMAYDIRIKNKLFTKPQVGFKYLYHYNDFVGATLKVSILEFHQTLSYEVISKKKYILKPNVGLNYRFYSWKGEMKEPLNTTPIRAWVIGVRHGNFILVSNDEQYRKKYRVTNLGFSFQIQNQFRINEKLWLHVTPFLEPDYDRIQNTGGCYVGIILK